MRRFQKTVWMPVAACLLAIAGLNARQDDKVVPVHEEPRHRLVFDSADTKILDIQIPPGDTTLFHTHSTPILYIPMSSSQTRSQTLGRDWSGGGAAPPSAPAATTSTPPRRLNSVTSYAKQPLTHRVNNVGQTLFRLIGVINASTGDPSTMPSSDFPGTPEVDNPWFRAHRQTLTEPTGEHRHANPVALIVIEGQASVPGVSLVPLPPRGGYVFLDANQPHTIRAVGGPAQMVEVEIRRPPSRQP